MDDALAIDRFALFNLAVAALRWRAAMKWNNATPSHPRQLETRTLEKHPIKLSVSGTIHAKRPPAVHTARLQALTASVLIAHRSPGTGSFGGEGR